MNVFEEHAKEQFHVHKGRSLTNLQELMDYLPLMDDDQFAYHVKGSKNDFSLWAEHIGAEQDVVELIKSATSREELQHALLNARDGSHIGIDEDDLFIKLKEEYAQRNETMLDKFDNIATHMQEALDDEMPEKLQKVEENLRDRYEELRLKVSEMRKAGKDTLIAALVLRQFAGKIAYAHASREEKDYEQAAGILKSVQEELDEAERFEEVNIRRDVLAMAGEEIKTDQIEKQVR